MASLDITKKNGAVVFAVRVQPGASCDEVAGEWQQAIRVRLMAPPVDDRANESLRRFLSARLKVPLAAVRIISGAHGRTKRVEVFGATSATVRALIPGNVPPPTRSQ